MSKVQNNSHFFQYGETETAYLKSRDPILGNAIDQIGLIQRPVIPDLFEALVNAVVGQQISTKAHITIWNRMQDSLGAITPEAIAAMGAEGIQRFGISMRKAQYIIGVADKVLLGELDLSSLGGKRDEDVCAALSALHGIGVWTAEMLMTFSMQRPNIMSYGDLAIHRGLRMLYHHRQVDRKLFAKYHRRYSPNASVACLYLWAIAGGAIAGMRDYAPGKKAKNRIMSIEKGSR